MGENEFLEGIYLILKSHQIRYCLISFIGIVNRFQAYIFFVLEETVELRMLPVERQFCKQEIDIFSD